MVRLAISVEGRTEARFVDMLLVPHLRNKKIHATPLLLGQSGGSVSLSRVGKDLNRLARSFDRVTTLYDFYGFKGKSVAETKDSLEQKILDSVAKPLRDRILPYIQMYEFEGLLFSSPEAMKTTIQEDGVQGWAQGVLNGFGGNPEAINDSRQTAPSKRLSSRTGYMKTVHGPGIAKETGLDVLRQTCAGFDSWLKRLESLNQ